MKYVADNEELIAEWDWDKNSKLNYDPKKLSVSSQEKVWWRCKEGHSWQATVANRYYRKYGCPYCVGKIVIAGINDLATIKPDLVEYWDKSKNESLLPTEISVSSGKKVWWICKKCGESFQRRVADMKRPYCSRCAQFFKTIKKEDSLGCMYPKLLEEWDYEKNVISPYEIKPHYNGKVYWICKKHKTSFYCSPDYRLSHNYGGCLECKKETLSKLHKKPKKDLSFIEKYNDIIEKYYDFTQNTDIDLSNVSYKSNRKANWKCKNCGTTWISKFQDMAEGRKCPKCETKKFKSFPEQCLFYYVQYYFNNVIWGYNKNSDINELDIFIPDKKIAIEYDGEHYHKSIKKDAKKDMACARKGIKLIRIREPYCPKYESSSIKIYRLRSDQDDKYVDLNNTIKIVLKIIEETIEYDVNIDRDLSSINELSALIEVSNSFENNYPKLAKQWDWQKNGKVKPSMVSKCSDNEYYFICQTCGESFKRRIASLVRSNVCECKTCARKRAHKKRGIAPKEKSIGYLYPSIAKELISSNNENIDIYTIYAKSSKKYLWKCSCGNIYEMSPDARVSGHACPECAKKSRKLKRAKKVICIETKEIFNSISEAGRIKKVDISDITKVCKGKQQTAGGYHWKYV